jgi:hypothetical protein
MAAIQSMSEMGYLKGCYEWPQLREDIGESTLKRQFSVN